MHIERTYDVGLLLSIALHPEIKPFICDVGQTPVVALHDSVYWLLPKYDDGGQFDDGSAMGFVAFTPINSIAWNPHIALLPEHRGNGTEAMKLGIRWMFENTPCRKIAAYPSSNNGAMIRVFEKCGFRHEGVSARSFSYDGTIYDRFAMGLEKP